MEINKGTHNAYKTELFMPIMKEATGKYIAVLSDDSVDRDDEKLSKSCVEKLGHDDNYLAALCNHKNDVFMQVAEWTNRGIKEIDGHSALVAEPKFFMSNPNAKIIKGMLDEGAKLGISIGAIVKNYDEVNGKNVFTELELLEASFVAIPSNRHGRAMAVAKSFNKSEKEAKMEKEFTQKDIDSAIEKKVEEQKTEFNKQLESKDSEISKLQDEMKKSEEEKEEATKESEEAAEEAEKKLKEMEESIEKVKKTALEKQQLSNEGGEEKETPEDAEKAFSEGKLPVFRK